MSDILSFLNLEASPKDITFNKYNSSGIPRNKTVKTALSLFSNLSPLQSIIRNVPEQVRLTIRNFTHQKPRLTDACKKELYTYYSAEIKLLESLINRDLSDWNYEE